MDAGSFLIVFLIIPGVEFWGEVKIKVRSEGSEVCKACSNNRVKD